MKGQINIKTCYELLNNKNEREQKHIDRRKDYWFYWDQGKIQGKD